MASPAASDLQSLRVAAREMFEESLFEDDDRRQAIAAEGASNGDRLWAQLGRRTLPEAYYVRASYLLDLDLMLNVGITFRATELTRDDYYGLRAVRLGTSDFQRMHPPCIRCGTNQKDRGAKQCWSCGAKFGGDN